MKKTWITTKVLSAGLIGVMTLSVLAGASASPITAQAEAVGEKVYAGTPHTPKSEPYKYNLKEGRSDYSVILYPDEALGWEADNPDIGYGTTGNLGCNDAADLTPKYTQQGYTYRYGLKLYSPSEEVLAATDYIAGTTVAEWTEGDGESAQKTGERTFTYNDKIHVKKDAKGPIRLKYKDYPEKETVLRGELRCSDGTHILRTYTAYTGFQFEAEPLGADSFPVSFDLGGGIVPAGEKYPTDFYFADEQYTYPMKAPVKLGYKFAYWDGFASWLEWSEDKFTVRKLDDSSWNTAKGLVENGVQLTARWQESKLTVTFDYNGGNYKDADGAVTDATEETTEININGIADDKEYYWFADYTERMYREGYLFDGWYIGDTRIECFNDIPQSVWNAEQKYTLTAHWKEDSEYVPPVEPKPQTNDKPVQADDKNKVTTTDKGKATIVEFKKTTSKSIKVPAYVIVEDYKYTVTTIEAKAFKNATKATTVTLPNTVKKIKANAFAKSKITTVKLTVKKGAKLTVDKKAFKNSKVKKVQVTISKKATAKEKNAIISTFTKAGIKKANIKIIKK